MRLKTICWILVNGVLNALANTIKNNAQTALYILIGIVSLVYASDTQQVVAFIKNNRNRLEVICVILSIASILAMSILVH